MLAFKTADLEVQRRNQSAYTTAPTHHLKSVAASAVHFLGHNTNQLSPPDRHTGSLPGGHESDMVLDGLRVELNGYLREPRMDSVKVTESQSGITVQWCDPLRYWAVRPFPHHSRCFSAVCTVC